MITVVQERTAQRHAPLSARVVFGVPHRRLDLQHGSACLFGPGCLVAYVVRANSRQRLFVFRTLRRSEPLSAIVPGVRPPVRLLMCMNSTRRIDRTRRMLRYVAQQTAEPERLSDAFYLRATTTLGGRAPIESVVRSLLRQEGPSWTC
jgi:hypothetical protein